MKNKNVLQMLASVQAKEDNLTNVLENVMEKASQQVIVLFWFLVQNIIEGVCV